MMTPVRIPHFTNETDSTSHSVYEINIRLKARLFSTTAPSQSFSSRLTAEPLGWDSVSVWITVVIVFNRMVGLLENWIHSHPCVSISPIVAKHSCSRRRVKLWCGGNKWLCFCCPPLTEGLSFEPSHLLSRGKCNFRGLPESGNDVNP